jgi:uncharacterized protein
MRTRDDHLFGPGPKRILSIDGGGVRGLLTLGMLKRIESILAARSPAPALFRLSDYFDLIGGTSTGGIMATLFALGKSVDEVTKLYLDMCPRIFGKPNFLSRFYIGSKFKAAHFRGVIDEVFDGIMHESGRQALLAPAQRPHHPNLGSDLLRTGLAIVAKRIDTSSLWVMTNNPRSKYWDRESEHWKDYFASQGGTFHPNRDYSLRAIVQASASAPFYLEPVEVEISPGQTGLFLDGGVSTCNNPSLELFYMATLKAFGDGGNGKGISPYAFDWKTGADNLYLLSVGTGTWRETEVTKKLKNRPPIIGAINALTSIMSDSDHNAVAVMQAISETPGSRFFVNSNVGDMRGLRMVSEPLLTYKRVTPLLTSDWLATSLAPGFAIKDRKLRYLREFDNANAKNLDLLQRIGAASGAQLIEDTDLPPSFDLPEWRRAAAA